MQLDTAAVEAAVSNWNWLEVIATLWAIAFHTQTKAGQDEKSWKVPMQDIRTNVNWHVLGDFRHFGKFWSHSYSMLQPYKTYMYISATFYHHPFLFQNVNPSCRLHSLLPGGWMRLAAGIHVPGTRTFAPRNSIKWHPKKQQTIGFFYKTYPNDSKWNHTIWTKWIHLPSPFQAPDSEPPEHLRKVYPGSGKSAKNWDNAYIILIILHVHRVCFKFVQHGRVFSLFTHTVDLWKKMSFLFWVILKTRQVWSGTLFYSLSAAG